MTPLTTFRDREGKCPAHGADVCEVCPGHSLAAALEPLREISHHLRTQDNRITAHPLFIVQQKRRIWGVHSDYIGTVAWSNVDSDGYEVEQSLALALEAQYRATGEIPAGFRRVGYVEIWEFVTACLTEAGAQAYIDRDGHNLKEPRIYAASLYRNAEMIALREFLMGIGSKMMGRTDQSTAMNAAHDDNDPTAELTECSECGRLIPADDSREVPFCSQCWGRS